MLLSLGLALCGQLLPLSGLWAAEVPPRCAGTDSPLSISMTDWEAGLGGWTVGTYDIASLSTFNTPDWTVVNGLPDGRSGMAAFVPNLDLGDCAADDESGVLTLTSPAIAIPPDADNLYVSFNHWFLIEYGWDGGNLKISVNGGPYTLVPASAFEAGPYTAALFDAYDEYGVTYNTNPLAEQEAFSGPDGDQAVGSWSESRVNLLGIAAPGDGITLRFDFGIDGCGGATGWYVDEVEVYNCAMQPPPNTSLTLVKEVVNNNGGAASPAAWTLAATGPTGFSGPGPSVSSGSGFAAGTYDLSEINGPAGYDSGAWGCNGGTQVDFDTITLAAGEQVTCTITNDDRAPSLTLVKQVVNNDGGTAVPANWILQATGPSGFSGPGPNVSSGANFQAGTYHLSENGGPPGYAASAWVCNGGTQNDADTVTLAQGQSAVCTITNDDPDQGFAINSGHAGAWFNPVTSGQGQFIDVEPASQFMFISWFTYTDADSAHPFEQRWFTAQGNYSGNTAQLVIYETLGGRFDDPQVPATLPVGEATLVFYDCEAGQMSYSIDEESLQGAFPLQRVIPGSGNTCTELSGNSTQAVDINAGMDGSWFEPATAGQGFFIDAYTNPTGSDFIFLSWFTYGDDTASGQRWLTAQGNFEGSTAVIDVNETTGGSFDDPRAPTTEKIGTMSLDFTDCSHALVTYELTDEGTAGEIPVTRVVAGSEALCEALAGAD